jgi:hypothetical protein
MSSSILLGLGFILGGGTVYVDKPMLASIVLTPARFRAIDPNRPGVPVLQPDVQSDAIL